MQLPTWTLFPQNEPPIPEVDPDNVEFVIFLRAKNVSDSAAAHERCRQLCGVLMQSLVHAVTCNQCHASGAMQATKLSKYPRVCRWLGYWGTPAASCTLCFHPNALHGQEDVGPDGRGTGHWVLPPTSPKPSPPPLTQLLNPARSTWTRR